MVLYQPEIPPNTGNIIRLCANTGTALHLIEPLGFQLEDRQLRRAGLDYHEWARVQVHKSYSAFQATRVEGRTFRTFAFTTKASAPFQSALFRPGDNLLFGPETRGLPAELLDTLDPAHWLRIPMRPQVRSLNLSNAVAVAVYEALRQSGYPQCC